LNVEKCVAIKNLYIFAFSSPVLPEIHFYSEGKRQQDFVVFFQITRMLLDGEKSCIFFSAQ